MSPVEGTRSCATLAVPHRALNFPKSPPRSNWDVLSNGNESRAEIPQEPGARGVLWEFLLQVWPSLNRTSPTQTASAFSAGAPGGSELQPQALAPLLLLGAAEHTSMWELLGKLPTQGQLFSWKIPIFRPAVGVHEGVGDPSQSQLLQPQIRVHSQPVQHLMLAEHSMFQTALFTVPTPLLSQTPPCIYGQNAKFQLSIGITHWERACSTPRHEFPASCGFFQALCSSWAVLNLLSHLKATLPLP